MKIFHVSSATPFRNKENLEAGCDSVYFSKLRIRRERLTKKGR